MHRETRVKNGIDVDWVPWRTAKYCCLHWASGTPMATYQYIPYLKWGFQSFINLLALFCVIENLLGTLGLALQWERESSALYHLSDPKNSSPRREASPAYHWRCLVKWVHMPRLIWWKFFPDDRLEGFVSEIQHFPIYVHLQAAAFRWGWRRLTEGGL